MQYAFPSSRGLLYVLYSVWVAALLCGNVNLKLLNENVEVGIISTHLFVFNCYVFRKHVCTPCDVLRRMFCEGTK
jgi:hypothetical protein